jgi:glutamate formiminotransferase
MDKDKLIITVPNFSVGDNRVVLNRIGEAFRLVPGVDLLGAEMDADHNRSVITAVGGPDRITEALYRGAGIGVELIDLRQHQGVHPRIGAVDVIPLIPYRGVSMEETVSQAESLGQKLAEDYELPVYLYGRAARSPGRSSLSSIRNSGFETLRGKIADDPSFKPDMGPRRLHPSAGAVAVGVRDFLIAFNVVLDSDDLPLARRIAAEIREAGGGLPGVKALGLKLAARGVVQVSMTLHSHREAGIWEAWQAVRDRAAQAGVQLLDSEIVGLVPQAALLNVLEKGIKLKGFSPDKILEVHLD